MSTKSLSGASGQGLATGAAIGLIFGLLLNNLVWGLVIGASMGLVFGSTLECDRRKASSGIDVEGDE